MSRPMGKMGRVTREALVDLLVAHLLQARREGQHRLARAGLAHEGDEGLSGRSGAGRWRSAVPCSGGQCPEGLGLLNWMQRVLPVGTCLARPGAVWILSVSY